MTTSVTVKNPESANYDVEVIAVDHPVGMRQAQYSTMTTLARLTPGAEFTAHAWDTRDILVREVPRG